MRVATRAGPGHTPAMMATLLVLCAAPAVGSTWSWSLDTTASGTVTGTIDGKKQTASLQPFHLGKVSVTFKVLEANARSPTKLDATVKSGPTTLEGRRWLVESDYGEARLVATAGSEPNVMQRSLEELRPDSVAKLRNVLSALFKEEPVVAATAGANPCDAATLAKVAAATGELIRNTLYGGTDQGVTMEEPSATCRGKGASYRVAVKMKLPWGADVLTLPWSGTVEVPPGAWRANVDLSTSATLAPKDSRVGLKGKVKAVLKSRLTRG